MPDILDSPPAPDPAALRPDKATIREYVAREHATRTRLGVPAAAAGVLYLLSGIILNASLNGLPTVGVLQALAPTLQGEINPPASPRAAEVRFVDHHAFGLIAGSVLQSVALVFLTIILLFLLGALRFRRPGSAAIARPLVLVAGSAMAVVVLGHALAQAIVAHNFVNGHDFGNHATEQALTGAAALQVSTYLGLIAGLGLTLGMVIVVLSTTRVGLIPRWMMYLGIVGALLAFTPFGDAFGFVQELILTFWLVAIGFLFMERLPADPPAWGSGEAMPWPSPAEMRAQQSAEKESRNAEKEGRKQGNGKGKGSSQSNGEVAPEPAQRSLSTSRRRKRKRSASGELDD